MSRSNPKKPSPPSTGETRSSGPVTRSAGKKTPPQPAAQRPLKLREAEDASDAERLLNDAQYRADVMRRVTKWLETEAKLGDVVGLVKHIPMELLKDEDPSRVAKKQLREMIEDATKGLQTLTEEIVLSSHLDAKFEDKDACVLERIKLLELLPGEQIASVAERFHVKLKKRGKCRQLAETITSGSKVKPKATRFMFPSAKYLMELYSDEERLKNEFARLIEEYPLCFRAIVFARLFDWKVADLTTDEQQGKTPKQRADLFWENVKGLEDPSTRDRLKAIGRLLHQRPVLYFQTIVTNLTGQNGWHNSAQTWTPALFEAVLRDDKRLSTKIDRLRDQFASVIWLNGLDEPSLRAIPRKFRAIRSDGPIVCKVMRSKLCGGSEDGLFAVASLPIGMTWLMGGSMCDDGEVMNIEWEAWNARIALAKGVRESFHGEKLPIEDDGVVGWKANEPLGEDAPNAVYFSSPDGVYLTVCREIHGSSKHPVEVLVDYGDNFPRVGYVRTRTTCEKSVKYAEDDLKQKEAAERALSVVAGVVRTKYYLKKKHTK